MSRIIQKVADHGSQYWLQSIMNSDREIIDSHIRNCMHWPEEKDIKWLSPLPDDHFAEYCDDAFVKLLNIQLAKSLTSFWPTHGPVWDGLARLGDSTLLLIEAKAHASELNSQMKAEAQPSIDLITQSLDKAKAHFGANPESDWTQPYYQYANRLAHLYFLREVNHVDARLVFVYFVNDLLTHGPRSESAWKAEIDKVHQHLGIAKDGLKDIVLDVFIDVEKLSFAKTPVGRY